MLFVQSLGAPILVVGMGRSGTSAVAASLQKLGFYGGEDAGFIQPDSGNPEGYFELSEFALVNDRIRACLGMLNNLCALCPADWQEYDGIRAATSQLKDLIAKDFGGRQHWALKDPRISLLLPIYEHVLGELGMSPTLAICVRNPLNTAASFSERFGAPINWAKGMWLQHTMAAVHASTRLRSRVVSYEQYLQDPATTLKPILELYPELEVPNSTWQELETRRKKGLNHGKYSDRELESIRPAAIKSAYELCLKMMADPKGLDQRQFADEIKAQWAEFESWWTLPPYEKALSSRLRLFYNTSGGQRKWETIYLPKRKAQTIEIAFDAPTGTEVEGQLSDWPGQYLVRGSRLTDVQGKVTPVDLEYATDILWVPHELGVIWTVPRIGNHFRFTAPGGQCRFSITFSTNTEPSEVSRIASEYWMECDGLRRRVSEMEANR